MELVVTEEQAELRSTLRRFFADRSPSGQVRRLMATEHGHDPAVWSQMADQLGLQGLAIPEEYGGAGYGMPEQAIVLEEMGRALLCAPYLSGPVLAAGALLRCGDEQTKQDLLPGIAAGTTIATLAWVEETGRWDPDEIAMTARRDRDEWILDGTKTYVLDGALADLVLVAARSPRGLSLFAAGRDTPGLTRGALPVLDQTRKLARLEFDGARAGLVGAEGAAGPGLTAALDHAAVALAAEQLGGAQRALDMTVDYAKVREQFGRPIGGFQAVKHRCADIYTEVESARSAVMYAATATEDELPAVASLAQAYCADAYFHAAAEAVQLHGGIGFTWEHDAHPYLKRAKSSQFLLGDPATIAAASPRTSACDPDSRGLEQDGDREAAALARPGAHGAAVRGGDGDGAHDGQAHPDAPVGGRPLTEPPYVL